MIPITQIELSPEYAGALVAGSVVLAIGVISLLAWSVRSLVSFTKVMRQLNEALAESYRQREQLREANEKQAARIDELDVNLRRADGQIVALQFDKGALKDEMDAMRQDAEARDKTHSEVVAALTAQIGQLKQAVADEQAARKKVERELTTKIDQLTEKNAALTVENQTLRADLAETKAALAETDHDRNGLQGEVAALRAEVEAMRAETRPAENTTEEHLKKEQDRGTQ